MIRASVSDARQRLPFLARLAEGGEVVVLVRRGKPIAQLVRIGEEVAGLAEEDARALLWLREGRIVRLGRMGPLLPKRWRPGKNGAGLSDLLLRDREGR